MLCVVKRIKLDKRKGSRDKVIKKSLIIILHCMLLSFISLYMPLKTGIKCESLGGTGGGGYYIKLLDFEKVCPLHSFCVPWNFMYSSSKCILHRLRSQHNLYVILTSFWTKLPNIENAT